MLSLSNESITHYLSHYSCGKVMTQKVVVLNFFMDTCNNDVHWCIVVLLLLTKGSRCFSHACLMILCYSSCCSNSEEIEIGLSSISHNTSMSSVDGRFWAS